MKEIVSIGDLGVTLSGWMRTREGSDVYVASDSDTYASLAAVYLGDAARAVELAEMQPGGRELNPGDVVKLPPEAFDRAREWGFIAEPNIGDAFAAGATDTLATAPTTTPGRALLGWAIVGTVVAGALAFASWRR